MPEGPDGKTIIIVKKVSGHGGAHGGAWKVAYADFVTAMMALFMVLWLVNSAAEPTRQRIASYFRKPGIFQKGSGTPMETGGGGILPDAFSPPADGNAQIQASEKVYNIDAQTGRVRELYDPGQGSKEFHYAPKIQGQTGEGVAENVKVDNIVKVSGATGTGTGTSGESEESRLQELKTEIEKAIEASKSSPENKDGVLGDIEIKVDQRGLVIEIMDTDKVSMFSSGQSAILSEAESKLTEIAQILLKVPNPIDIEGHTDGHPFKSSKGLKYDNWNLSTDRANAARRVLEAAGFKRGQIARVVGYADERLKDPTNPLNSANRRITISMRYSNRAKVALDGKQIFETSTASRRKEAKAEPVVVPKPNVAKENVDPPEQEAPVFNHEVKSEVIEETEDQPHLENKGKDQLNVEVSTILPEGAEELEDTPKIADEERKSLIFESKDAFFKR